MARELTFEEQFKITLEEYSKRYDIESLSNPNDVANLETMIRNQIIIKTLQRQMSELAVEGDADKLMDIKKINDSITSLTAANIQLEKALAIDRKTRKGEQEQSVVDYINTIKKLAREFLDDNQRLTKVHCKYCKIMVGRISGVYDTTEFEARFQCPQCKKFITISRKERDVFFDIKDADWRRKHPIEIIQAKRLKDAPDVENTEDDLVIGDDIEYGEVEDGISSETN